MTAVTDLFEAKKLTLIAGPCVVEAPDMCLTIAERVRRMCDARGISYIFKASYDKANRTSGGSFRGRGMDEGLETLARVRKEIAVPVLTDIHESVHAATAAEVVDVLQIPAFLCRQTDLLLAAAKTGKAVNVKKGQFVAPEDMKHAVKKVRDGGAKHVALTERGATFGYHNLVVDMRGLVLMREAAGCPVVFDATHSVQRPSSGDGVTGGDRRFAPVLARAAAAVGIDGLFCEVHPNPDQALSDGPNSLTFELLEKTLDQVIAVESGAAGDGLSSIVITGANTGIGRATAEGLAGPGVQLILAGRSLERTQPVIDAVRARGADAEFVELDLGSLASIRKVVAELAQRPRIDVLVNNAGVAGVRGQTSDGFEVHVGINHLGHFALTTGLIAKLTADRTRVVCVASEAHRRAKGLDFGAFEQLTATRTGWREYCASKLCNVLFAAELARRYGGQGVLAVSLHPGVIASDLWRHLPAPLRLVAKLFMRSNSEGARTSIHCATAALDAGLNGSYFDKAKPKKPMRLARDEALAGELWERSARMVSR